LSTCQYCSEEVEPGAVKCRHCGEPLVAKKVDTRPTDDLSAVMGWVFQDPNWVVKIVIGTASLLLGCFLFLIPIFALSGFKLRIARQQRRAPGATPMPEWDDWGTLIVDGLKEFCCMASAGMMLVGTLTVLALIGPAVDFMTTGKAGLFTGITVGAAYLGLIIGAFTMQYFIPAIELELLETGSPLSTFHFRSIWRRITKRPGDYFMMFIYHFVVTMIGQFGAILLYAPIVWSLYTQGAILGRYLAQQRVKDAALDAEALGPSS
jgi:hypothetical protein